MSDWIEGSPEGLRSRELALAKAEIERLNSLLTRISDAHEDVLNALKCGHDADWVRVNQIMQSSVHLIAYARGEKEPIQRAREATKE